jgi:hypothetical protein
MCPDPRLDVATLLHSALDQLIVRRGPVGTLCELVNALPADAAEPFPDLCCAHQLPCHATSLHETTALFQVVDNEAWPGGEAER